MENTTLLQDLPDIVVLVTQRGRDCEQSVATDRTLARFDSTTDLVLNHRLAQGIFGSVDGGLHSLDPQKAPLHLSPSGTPRRCEQCWPTAFARSAERSAPPPAAT